MIVPFVMRKLDKKERWDKDKMYSDYPWLKENDIPAECLTDLRANRNEISLWYVENNNDLHLPYICAALAAKSGKADHFEYALFDINLIEKASFDLHKTDGEIPDESIAHLHRDINELTAAKLVRFLEAVWANVQTDFIPRKKIEELIDDNISRYNKNYVHGDIRKRFAK